LSGERHPSIASYAHNIGSLYNERGEPDKALEYMQKAHSMFFELLGKRHPKTLMSLRSLARFMISSVTMIKHPNAGVWLQNEQAVPRQKSKQHKSTIVSRILVRAFCS